jgi:peptidoglycan/LPS O-acetylase OafA/YrhL
LEPAADPHWEPGSRSFFVISGFLIVKSFESSTGNFNSLSKRVLRIYPGLIVAYLISILIVGFWGSGMQHNWEGYWQYFHDLYKKKELVRMFSLQSPYQRVFFKGSPEHAVNDSLWTIQFEFVCYLLGTSICMAGFL